RGQGGWGEAERRRRIPPEDAPAEPLLDLLDMSGDQAERLQRVGQGKQMIEIGAAPRAPGQMPGDQARLDDVGKATEAVEMMPIERTGRAERQTHPVERDRVVSAHALERGEGSGVGHVVLRVHLDPGDGGTPGQELAHVRSPEPDAREGLLIDHWRLRRPRELRPEAACYR